MAFPASPSNGQRYKNKIEDSTSGVWKDAVAPTTAGAGASGTWAIGITGSAVSVTSGAYFKVKPWVNSPGVDADMQEGNTSGFTYANNAPHTLLGEFLEEPIPTYLRRLVGVPRKL